MRSRGVLLLACAALATAALAAPSHALADGALRDVKTGKTIAESESLPFVGSIEFRFLGSGIQCEVETDFLSKKSVSEFSVPQFQLETKSCFGFGILFQGCTVVEDEPTGLPWRGEVEAADLEFGSVAFDGKLAECETGLESFEAELSILTAETSTGSEKGITALTLSGEGVVEIAPGGFAVEVSGSLTMQGGNSDTYDIEPLP